MNIQTQHNVKSIKKHTTRSTHSYFCIGRKVTPFNSPQMDFVFKGCGLDTHDVR